MRKIVFLLSILFFSACAGTKTTVTETREKVETLTITNEVKLDTTIFIPGEKVSLFIPIEKATIKSFEKPKVFTQKKGRASVTVKIDSTGITATSNCDSIAKKLNYYRKLTKQLRLEVTDTKITATKKKGYSLIELILYMTATGVVCFAAAYILKSFKIL